MVCQGDTLMKDQSVSAWGLARSSRVLRANPVDVPIGQVVDQDVVRVFNGSRTGVFGSKADIRCADVGVRHAMSAQDPRSPNCKPGRCRRGRANTHFGIGVSFLNAEGIGPVSVFVVSSVRSFEEACGASILRFGGAFCGVNIAIYYLEVRQAPIAQQIRPRRFPVLVPNPKQRNAVVNFGALP
jgi:hypothetical protein